MPTMTIGRLAKQAGVNIDTIRYYERNGLIPEPLRRASGYRQYGVGDLRRLRFILRAKDLGFTLAEIGEDAR
jgi:MerR family copper efflux transcriptional regulator